MFMIENKKHLFLRDAWLNLDQSMTPFLSLSGLLPSGTYPQSSPTLGPFGEVEGFGSLQATMLMASDTNIKRQRTRDKIFLSM